MKFICTMLLLVAALSLTAQTTATFENFNLAPGEFLNDAGVPGAFADGNIALPNTYDADFDFWTGWAISAATDNQTPGFLNQYSAITGSGFNGSATYAVSYASPPSVIRLTGDATGGAVNGMYVTNSAYAYFSMKDGDAFAKRFGGITGNDPDFFLLTVKKYLDGQLANDSINFYLADYRSANNSEDYLTDDWTWLDLTPLGNADSLQFSLSSSDNGAFGMNTPAYFCMDDLTTADMPLAAGENPKPLIFNIFPNPATNFLTLNWQGTSPATAVIFNSNGAPVFQKNIRRGNNRLEVTGLPAGIYWASMYYGSSISSTRFVIK